MNKNIKARSHLVTLLILSVVLSACGGDRVIKTVDDSADYKSARSLPPLNKKLVKLPAEAIVDQAPAVDQASSTDQVPTAEQASAADNTPTVNSSESRRYVNSELVNVNATTTRLEVELPSDAALDYLADKLVASGLTVHHRNVQAGRISIGCGDIQSAPTTKKKSRWTFSGRKLIDRLDYCALELSSNRRGTVVKVLDLNQQEVEKSAAEQIFQRILVN